MRSIPTIFCWSKETNSLTNRPLRLVDWVFQGKGIPTRKYDGIAIKVENGKVYRRYEWKEGQVAPNGFIRCEALNPKKPNAPIPCWVPVPETFLTRPVGPDEKALKEAWTTLLSNMKLVRDIPRSKMTKTTEINPYEPIKEEKDPEVPNGTYELCGPKIRGNHEKLKNHVLLPHGAEKVKGVPRTFEKLKTFLETFDGEGIVWHYDFGGSVLMAKIKRRDFGFMTRFSKEDVEMAYRKEEDQKGEDIPQSEAEEAFEEMKEQAIATELAVEQNASAM